MREKDPFHKIMVNILYCVMNANRFKEIDERLLESDAVYVRLEEREGGRVAVLEKIIRFIEMPEDGHVPRGSSSHSYPL
jgi:hypothetical protein